MLAIQKELGLPLVVKKIEMLIIGSSFRNVDDRLLAIFSEMFLQNNKW